MWVRTFLEGRVEGLKHGTDKTSLESWCLAASAFVRSPVISAPLGESARHCQKDEMGPMRLLAVALAVIGAVRHGPCRELMGARVVRWAWAGCEGIAIRATGGRIAGRPLRARTRAGIKLGRAGMEWMSEQASNKKS